MQTSSQLIFSRYPAFTGMAGKRGQLISEGRGQVFHFAFFNKFKIKDQPVAFDLGKAVMRELCQEGFLWKVTTYLL